MKKLILIALAISTSFISFSQNKKGRGEKIQELKIAFLTEELNLSVEEGQNFWPVYNAYQEKRKDLNQALREILKNFHEIDKITDSDISGAIDKTADIKIQLVTAEADYFHNSLGVLGSEKTVALVKSEKKFKKKILQDMRNKQSENNPPLNQRRQ